MKWKEWLDQWSMVGLRIKSPFLEAEWKPQDKDRDAAWELYIELLTRVSTQHFRPESGDEISALNSIHGLFDLTRSTLKRHGRHAGEFAKIAIIVLNQVVRPFTTKWHKEFLTGSFKDPVRCEEFRNELSELQLVLRRYTRMLGDMAGVEDLTELEMTES